MQYENIANLQKKKENVIVINKKSHSQKKNKKSIKRYYIPDTHAVASVNGNCNPIVTILVLGGSIANT